MKVKRDPLKKALEIVKPGLANKELIEQSTSFAFIKGYVVTYNDKISVRHPVPNLNIEGAVQAEALYGFISKLKAEEFDMEITDTEIVVSSGRSKAGLTLMSEIKLPLKEEIVPVKKWIDLPKEFIKFLGFAMTSCAIDRSLELFTYVHVDAEGVIEATDSFRVCRCLLKEPLEIESFLIPASSVEEVVKLNPTQIAVIGGWVHFRTEEDTIISCRTGDGKFKNLEALCYVEGNRIVLPKTIDETVDRAMVIASRPHLLDEELLFSIKDNRLKIEAKSDKGWFKEELNMPYKDSPITITVTPYLLKGIMSENRECIVGKGKLKFQGDGWIYTFVLKQED